MSQVKLIKQRKEQIIDWRTANQLGFDIWKTTTRFGEGQNDFFTLEATQCRDGLYIIQIDQRDFSWLVFKCQPDICITSIK